MPTDNPLPVKRGNVVRNIWVNGATGDDSNSGLSMANALKTLQGVYKKYPTQQFGPGSMTIKLASVGGFDASAVSRLVYDEQVVLVGGSRAYKSSYRYVGQMVHAVLATGLTTTSLDTSSPVTVILGADSSTVIGHTLHFSTAAPGWTVHDLRGKRVRIKRGANLVMFQIPIADNTATTIQLDVPNVLAVGLLHTDTVEIVEPGVLIYNSVDSYISIQGKDSLNVPQTNPSQAVQPSTFECIGFEYPHVSGFGMSFDRCDFSGDCEIHGDGSSIINCVGRPTLLVSPGTTHTLSWCGGAASGIPQSNPEAGQIDKSVNMTLMNCASTFQVGLPQEQSSDGTAVCGTFISHYNLSVYTTSPEGVKVRGPGSLLHMNSYEDIANSFLGNAIPNACLGGVAAAVGLVVLYDAQMRVNPGSRTWLTGTSAGDMRCEDPIVRYGTGTGNFEDPLTWAGSFSSNSRASSTKIYSQRRGTFQDTPMGIGRVLRVDSIFGNDAVAARNKFPFASIPAALAAAAAYDTVLIYPGTYECPMGITVPDNVSIVGLNRELTVIQKTMATANSVMVTMGVGSVLENLWIRVTAAEHHDLYGIFFPAGTNDTARARNCRITLNQSSASTSGTSDLYGAIATGVGGLAPYPNLDSSLIELMANGDGAKTGVFVSGTTADTVCGFRWDDNDVNITLGGTAGTGAVLTGFSTNHSSSVAYGYYNHYNVQTFTIDNVSTGNDLAQNAGYLEIDGTTVLNVPNGLPFHASRTKSLFFGNSGSLAVGTHYLYQGTEAASTNEIQIPIARHIIVLGIRIHVRDAPTGASEVYTLRKAGVDTAITVTLAISATDVEYFGNSVSFGAASLLSLKVVSGIGKLAGDDPVVEVVYI